MSGTCIDCAKTLGAKNKSGRCRSCIARNLSAQPDWAEKQRAGIRRRFAEPGYLDAHVARLKAAVSNLTPEQVERRRQHGRRMVQQTLQAPAVLARSQAPETRARAGAKRSETVLAWCPPEWRDKYRDLKKRGRRAADAKRIVLDLIAGKPEPEKYQQQKARLAWCPADRRADYDLLKRKGMTAAEARAAVEAEMAREASRPKRPLTFEEKLARVANGARLVSNVMPTRPAHSFTLGGVASSSL